MDQKQMLKQMLEFNQAAFNNTFNAMTELQDQFERPAKTVGTSRLVAGRRTPGH